MARIDDYEKAFALALEELKKGNLHHVASKSGARVVEKDGGLGLELPFIDRFVRIGVPEGSFSDEKTGGDIPIQEKVLILHYLNKATGGKVMQDWVTYREIPDGSFYFAAFAGRAINPFKATFGDKPDVFDQVAPLLGGTPVEEGDTGFLFVPFPHVPMKLILWRGDDEFPAEANILFDRTVSEYLSAEDIAWTAGMVVYRLMALSRQKG